MGRRGQPSRRPAEEALLPLRVAVVGAGSATAAEEALADELGERLAARGTLVITGGLGGVMAAASRGASRAGGCTVGLLPGDAAGEANPFVLIPIPTGMGEARNVLVVRAAEALVAVGGEWGRLSEIALARKTGRAICLLGPGFPGLDLPRTADAEEAAGWACEAARRFREGRADT
jgi:hypothetical protein